MSNRPQNDPHSQGSDRPDPEATIEDSMEASGPDDPAAGETVLSDDLSAEEFERLQRMWSAAVSAEDADVGKTIKVEELLSADSGAAPDDTSPDSDRTIADPSLQEADAEETEPSSDESAEQTIPDDGVAVPPQESGDATVEIEDSQATLPDSAEFPDPDQTVSDESWDGRTIAEEPSVGGAAEGADQTVVTDDEDDDDAASPAAEEAGGDGDQTVVVEDEGETDAPSAPAAGGDADQTVVSEDDEEPPAVDGTAQTFLSDEEDADQAESEGTFQGSGATFDPVEQVDQTVVGEDLSDEEAAAARGAQGGDATTPDTWHPQRDLSQTHHSDGGSAEAPGYVPEDISVVVRQRMFRMGEEAMQLGADYQLLNRLGEGGMGVVYEATQTSINRSVAVKMLKPPKAKKKLNEKKARQQRTKFLAEAVVTGDLDHPNIVPVYDLGTNDEGAVFYSMKCVEGTPWDEVVGEKPLSENLEIFMKVADAVAFAHSRGVIHRDLKPENTMLGGFGEVLVMDWGLALTTDQFEKTGAITRKGSIGGTPSYMAPEMASGETEKIGPASDVYLLGAILYEVVTGRPPHAGADVMKCLMAAAKNEIQPTDKSGELVDIALRAMATNPGDRYPSVQALQDAIRDYQSHTESVALCNRASTELAQALESNDYEDFSRAMYAFQEAYEMWTGNREAREGVSRSRREYARCAVRRGDLDLASSLLLADDPAHDELRNEVAAAIQERKDRQKRAQRTRQLFRGAVVAIVVIVSGAAVWINAERQEAVAQFERAEKQKKIADKERDKAVVARNEAEEAAEAEKQAKLEAIAAQEKAEEAAEAEKKAKLAEAEERKKAELARMKAEKAAEAERKAKLAEAEERMKAEKARKAAVLAKMKAEKAAAAEKKAKLAEAKERKKAEEARKKAVAAAKAEEKAKLEAIAAQKAEAEERKKAEIAQMKAEKAAIAERKAREAEEYEAYVALIGLAAARIDENAFDSARELLQQCPERLRNWEWGRLMYLCSQSSQDFPAGGPVDTLAVAPSGKWFATGSWNGEARIWSLEEPQAAPRKLPHGGLYVHGVDVSPDGKLVATGGSGADYVRLWDARTGEPLDRDFEGHEDAVLSVQFSHDGKYLLTSSYDNTARLWDVATGKLLRTYLGHNWWVWTARFSPDESRIVTASQDGTVVVWKLEPGKEEGQSDESAVVARFRGHDGPVYVASFSPDGKTVVSGGYDRRLLVWNPDEVKPFDYRAAVTGEDVAAPRVTSLTGHDGAVRDVRFSSDGKLVVSGAQDNTVRVWNLETNRALKTFRGHDGWVRAVAFTPDGRSILSGSQDDSAKSWSIAGYEELRVLRGRVLDGHYDAILSAHFSPDGDSIVTASRDRSARTWDRKTGEPLQEFSEGHLFLTSSSLFFPDGKQLLTAAADNTTRLWDVKTGTELRQFDNTGRAAALDLSSDGQWLLTGSDAVRERDPRTGRLERTEDYPVKIWNTRSGELVRTLHGHRSEVTAVAFSPDDSLFYTGDAKGNGRLWDTETGEVRHVLRGHNRRIQHAVFLPDGSRVLTASGDNTVGQWDVATGEEDLTKTLKHPDAVVSMAAFPGVEQVVTACSDGVIRVFDVEAAQSVLEIPTEAQTSEVAVSPDGRRILSVEPGRGLVRAWDAASGEEIPGPRDERALLDYERRGGLVWSARFSPDGRKVLTVGGSDARLWDFETTKLLVSFSPHGAVASAYFSPDGQHVVTASWDNSAKVWDARTGRAIVKLEGGHDGYVNSAVFAPPGFAEDGRFVLTASDDRTAKLWRVDVAAGTAEVVRVFSEPDAEQRHSDAILFATFSPDGSLVVTCSNDRTVRFWDARTGEPAGKPLEGHVWGVLQAAFSPDGKRIATASEDNSVIVWNVETREEQFTLEGHTAAVSSVAWSPDGSRVLSGSRDNTVKVWDPGTGKEILTLGSHTEEVTSVAFSPQEGRYALSGSRDGRAIVWLAIDWEAKAEPEVALKPE